jgi:hypothetical protein
MVFVFARHQPYMRGLSIRKQFLATRQTEDSISQLVITRSDSYCGSGPEASLLGPLCNARFGASVKHHFINSSLGTAVLHYPRSLALSLW